MSMRTLAEVAQHNSSECEIFLFFRFFSHFASSRSCWVVIEGKIYDVTEFLLVSILGTRFL